MSDTSPTPPADAAATAGPISSAAEPMADTRENDAVNRICERLSQWIGGDGVDLSVSEFIRGELLDANRRGAASVGARGQAEVDVEALVATVHAAYMMNTGKRRWLAIEDTISCFFHAIEHGVASDRYPATPPPSPVPADESRLADRLRDACLHHVTWDAAFELMNEAADALEKTRAATQPAPADAGAGELAERLEAFRIAHPELATPSAAQPGDGELRNTLRGISGGLAMLAEAIAQGRSADAVSLCHGMDATIRAALAAHGKGE